jgi:hypothetical protein
VKGTKTRTSKNERKESKNPVSMREGILKYLWGERKIKIMARFRCRNEERESKYWMEGEERRCRMCYEERETIEHMEKKGEKY